MPKEAPGLTAERRAEIEQRIWKIGPSVSWPTEYGGEPCIAAVHDVPALYQALLAAEAVVDAAIAWDREVGVSSMPEGRALQEAVRTYLGLMRQSDSEATVPKSCPLITADVK